MEALLCETFLQKMGDDKRITLLNTYKVREYFTYADGILVVLLALPLTTTGIVNSLEYAQICNLKKRET